LGKRRRFWTPENRVITLRQMEDEIETSLRRTGSSKWCIVHDRGGRGEEGRGREPGGPSADHSKLVKGRAPMFPLTNANRQQSHSQPGGKQQAHRHSKDKQPATSSENMHQARSHPEHRQHARSKSRRTSTKATSSELEGPGGKSQGHR